MNDNNEPLINYSFFSSNFCIFFPSLGTMSLTGHDHVIYPNFPPVSLPSSVQCEFYCFETKNQSAMEHFESTFWFRFFVRRVNVDDLGCRNRARGCRIVEKKNKKFADQNVSYLCRPLAPFNVIVLILHISLTLDALCVAISINFCCFQFNHIGKTFCSTRGKGKKDEKWINHARLKNV